jgi:hypothetical protein
MKLLNIEEYTEHLNPQKNLRNYFLFVKFMQQLDCHDQNSRKQMSFNIETLYVTQDKPT